MPCNEYMLIKKKIAYINKQIINKWIEDAKRLSKGIASSDVTQCPDWDRLSEVSRSPPRVSYIPFLWRPSSHISVSQAGP